MKRLEVTGFAPLDYAGSEALNTLCTNLSFAGSDVKKIMISSCRAGEGKTFISMNILRTMAGLGKRVVLVDADLRRSATNGKYGLKFSQRDNPGLAHYLAGICGADDVVYQTSLIGAHIVPVGKRVSGSLSLLNSDRFSRLLDRLAEQFELVLVDTSPVGVIIDAAEVAKSCDGALLIASYDSVTRGELREARRMVERAGCQVLGAVLNKVPPGAMTGKKYYYGRYQYRAREGAK